MNVKLAGVAVLVAACGGHRAHTDDYGSRWDCRERDAAYTAAHHISGDEIGVEINCAASGPQIKRWKTDKGGKHVEDTRVVSPVEFDKIWAEIDGTGWSNLKMCPNGSLDKHDPIYQFDIKDDTNTATFTCQTREVPYPYFDITNALDLAANQGRKQLGDDEPADAKALDHKDKQR